MPGAAEMIALLALTQLIVYSPLKPLNLFVNDIFKHIATEALSESTSLLIFVLFNLHFIKKLLHTPKSLPFHVVRSRL